MKNDLLPTSISLTISGESTWQIMCEDYPHRWICRFDFTVNITKRILLILLMGPQSPRVSLNILILTYAVLGLLISTLSYLLMV